MIVPRSVPCSKPDCHRNNSTKLSRSLGMLAVVSSIYFTPNRMYRGLEDISQQKHSRFLSLCWLQNSNYLISVVRITYLLFLYIGKILTPQDNLVTKIIKNLTFIISIQYIVGVSCAICKIINLIHYFKVKIQILIFRKTF